MSVTPSRALTVNTCAGFQPIARSRDTSASSSLRITAPVAALRSTVTGAVSTREYVSTMYLPLGLTLIT